MTTPQLVFENRTGVKPAKPFKFGPLTDSRVDKAIERTASPYAKTAPTFLTLKPGEQIAISGQRDSSVTFMGIENGGLHYRAHSGHELIRPLKRISFGLRFDIYSAGYWTRESVQSTIPSSLVTNFKAEGVSRVQSAEIVVFDKKTGDIYPMWLSLGVNKDQILEKTEPPPMTYQRTASLPQRDMPPPVRTVVKTDLRPKPDQQAPQTVGMLGMDEAMKIATEVYRRKTVKSPISEVKFVMGSQILNVAGQNVLISSDNGIIRVSYKEDGKQRETTISPEIIKNEKGHYVDYFGSQYHVVYTVFRLKTEKLEQFSKVLVFGSIYTWDNRHYGTFAFGAA
ncbi:MAG: hypothetical protein MN733_33395 [Nitrososphaera sp.]|nr:hypothetical protein [Nitrososphaera sp.]